MNYLLDTNICIYYLKGLYDLDKKIQQIGLSQCAISEITVAELKFGIENSQNKHSNSILIGNFIDSISIIPIITSFNVYAKEKVRLRKMGNIIDEFDLLIGSSAIANNMILVTANTKHFDRLENIKIENWIK
ncbi:MAG: PIN domain-containing protein [Spirochaetales bacterium]|nr:PIN domain-containing protein [Spirochaetales bacterium]